MRRNIREKVLRTIVSSILSSTLTIDDIRMVADSISHGDDFAYDLANLLRDMVHKLDKYAIDQMKSKNRDDNVNSVLYEALEIVKRKRLSKSKIINMITAISPNDYLSTRESKLFAREILEDFFSRTSTENASRLLKLLETKGSERDEYLEGIMRKK